MQYLTETVNYIVDHFNQVLCCFNSGNRLSLWSYKWYDLSAMLSVDTEVAIDGKYSTIRD